MKKNIIFILLILVISQLSISAQNFKLAPIFTDNMVLQQQSKAPIWGTDKAGAQITVSTSWDGAKYSSKADKNGKWKVEVNTPKAGGPYTVSVNGSKQVTLHDVLIGEVWLFSGQSNMSMPVKGYYCQPVEGANEAIMESANKKINYINVTPMAAYMPIDTFSVVWNKASLETTAECSAVAWFFADRIQKYINVPIGIINASYGGSIVEAWMNPEACKQFNDIEIPKTSTETSPWINNVPTVLYNGMIHPIEGYTIKGALWYQGESNIFNVPRYAPSVVAMVKEWRRIWNCGEFPFYFAQITPHEYRSWNFFTPQWPEISAYLREAQCKIETMLPNSAMSVNMDLGHETQIHPARKKEVGDRLALLALNKTYNMKGFEAESPRYEKMVVDGDKAIIHFDRQFNGLTSYEKTLELFEIAGENQVFHKAEAYIDGDKGTIVVSNRYVKEPKAVRYAYRNWVVGELFGTGGLPVSSFRTDNW